MNINSTLIAALLLGNIAASYEDPLLVAKNKSIEAWFWLLNKKNQITIIDAEDILLDDVQQSMFGAGVLEGLKSFAMRVSGASIDPTTRIPDNLKETFPELSQKMERETARKQLAQAELLPAQSLSPRNVNSFYDPSGNDRFEQAISSQRKEMTYASTQEAIRKGTLDSSYPVGLDPSYGKSAPDNWRGLTSQPGIITQSAIPVKEDKKGIWATVKSEFNEAMGQASDMYRAHRDAESEFYSGQSSVRSASETYNAFKSIYTNRLESHQMSVDQLNDQYNNAMGFESERQRQRRTEPIDFSKLLNDMHRKNGDPNSPNDKSRPTPPNQPHSAINSAAEKRKKVVDGVLRTVGAITAVQKGADIINNSTISYDTNSPRKIGLEYEMVVGGRVGIYYNKGERIPISGGASWFSRSGPSVVIEDSAGNKIKMNSKATDQLNIGNTISSSGYKHPRSIDNNMPLNYAITSSNDRSRTDIFNYAITTQNGNNPGIARQRDQKGN